MAWSRTQLSATDRALFAADKPMFVGTNRARDATIQWRTTGSFASGSDLTNSAYPTYRTYDGFAHNLRTRPASSQDPWYLLFNFGSNLDFDSIVIIGHNLGVASMSVSAQIADNNAFSTNLETLATWTPSAGSTTRLVKYDLDHAGSSSYLYSAQYARILVNPASAMVPEISEVIFGQRRQLTYNPNNDFDPDSERTRGKSFEAKSGVKTFYVSSRRQKTLESEHTLVSGDIAAVRSLWQSDTEGGEYPFLWIPKPFSEGNNAYLMRFEDGDEGIDFGLPYDGPSARDWELSAKEIPIYRADEV